MAFDVHLSKGVQLPVRRQILNVPNALTAVRIFGSLVLIGLALTGQATAFICVYVFLFLTDWFDGKLAILLHQRTVFGARLDSFADALLYVTLLFGLCLLKWDFVAQHAAWIIPAVATYLLSATTGLVKFRRLPSYHTYAAKASANLFNIAVVCSRSRVSLPVASGADRGGSGRP